MNIIKSVSESQKLEGSSHQSNNFIMAKRFHLIKDLFTATISGNDMIFDVETVPK